MNLRSMLGTKRAPGDLRTGRIFGAKDYLVIGDGDLQGDAGHTSGWRQSCARCAADSTLTVGRIPP